MDHPLSEPADPPRPPGHLRPARVSEQAAGSEADPLAICGRWFFPLLSDEERSMARVDRHRAARPVTASETPSRFRSQAHHVQVANH